MFIIFSNGIICGILFILFLYHLIIFFIKKEKGKSIYLGVALVIFSFLLYILFSSTYIKPEYFNKIRNIYLIIPSLIIIFNESMILLAKNILKREKLPSEKMFRIPFILYLIYGILDIFFKFDTNNKHLIGCLALIFCGSAGLYALVFFIFIFIKDKIYLLEANRIDKTKIILTIGYGLIIINIISAGFNNVFFKQQEKVIIEYLGFLITALVFTIGLLVDFYNSYTEVCQIKENLEKEVKKRTIELEKAKNIIEEKEKQKTTFFINLTHETKTPLTLITNYLDKHIKKHGTTEEIKIIQQNVNKLQHDAINFLDAEKLERGQVLYNHDQIINLTNIVCVEAMMFKEIAIKKNINITTKIDENIYIKIDPHAIDRIINNLLDNAIKFTPENGQINIILTSNNDEAEFIVSDTGIGIPIEDQKNIFEPYYQITHEKQNIQGIGMGLHIVKKIIYEINGKIDLQSHPDKGSTFKITFKKHKLLEGETVNENIKYSKPIDNISTLKIKEATYNEQRQTILIIEDNINMLCHLRNNICNYYNVFCAVNGKDALDKLENIPKPNLIIADIMMDVMDGIAFFETLIKNEQYKDIPVIFLTAKTSINEKIQAILKGAIDYIYKPFSIEELLAKINAIIKLQGLQKEFNIKEMEQKISNVIRSKNKDIEDIKNNGFEGKCSKYRITAKEQETIKLLLEGLETKEIASNLNVNTNTVKKRLSYIYKKCDVQNKLELFKIFH